MTTPKKRTAHRYSHTALCVLVGQEYAMRWFVTKQSTTKPKVGGVITKSELLMQLYKVGDIVRITPFSHELWNTHSGLGGLFINEQMGRASQVAGATCRVRNVVNNGPFRYRLEIFNCPPEGRQTVDAAMQYTWAQEWLVSGHGDGEKPEAIDYNGNVIAEDDLGDYIQLTFPSGYESMYAKLDEVEQVGPVRMRRTDLRHALSCSYGSFMAEVVVLSSEFDEDDFVEVVDGDNVYKRHFDLIYLERGCHEGEMDYTDNGRYCEDDGCWYHSDDVEECIFYWDRDGEYHTHEEPGEQRHDYHNGPRQWMDEARKYDVGFTIGFEVEKESQGVLDDFDLDECDRTGWARESDSSLCDDFGYEFVSPVFALYGDALEKDKDSGVENPVVRAHINGDYSRNCGGHINLGHSSMSSEQIFDKVQGWIPLLLALYPGRMTRDYSHAKKTVQHYKNGGKYQAIAVRGSVVEFRIFSAVPDVNTLLWRRDLVRIMCDGITPQTIGATPMAILRMLTNTKSKLYRHLSKVYSDDKILRITSMYAQFADDLFNTYMLGTKGEGVLFKTFITTSKRKRVPVETLLPAVTYGFTRLTDAFSTIDHLQSEALVRR